MDRGAWRATVHGVTRVGHDWLFTSTFNHKWQTFYLCFWGQLSLLVSCHPSVYLCDPPLQFPLCTSPWISLSSGMMPRPSSLQTLYVALTITTGTITHWACPACQALFKAHYVHYCFQSPSVALWDGYCCLHIWRGRNRELRGSAVCPRSHCKWWSWISHLSVHSGLLALMWLCQDTLTCISESIWVVTCLKLISQMYVSPKIFSLTHIPNFEKDSRLLSCFS